MSSRCGFACVLEDDEMNLSLTYLAAAALVVGASTAGQANGVRPVVATQVASAATPQSVDLKPLNAAKIKAQVVGNTITGADDSGPFTQFFVPDGTFRGVGQEDFYTGTWQISNNQMCTHLDSDDGDNKGWDCTPVTVIDNKLYWSGDVSEGDEPEATLIHGNPTGL
jgi:hypothetical protein